MSHRTLLSFEDEEFELFSPGESDEERELLEVEAKHPQAMVATRCGICGERIASSDVALCLDCMDEEVGD